MKIVRKVRKVYKVHKVDASISDFTNFMNFVNLKTSAGFTLVEVFISLAIFVAVIVAVGTFEIDIFANQRTVSSSFEEAQNAQVILKTMLTELRQSATAANGAYPIATAGTSSITFFSNANNAAGAEEITYSMIGNTLYRAIVQPTGSPLTYNIANQATSSILVGVYNSSSTPIFQYFDQNYTGTSSPLSLPINIPTVRLMKISLTLKSMTNKTPTFRTYTTQVSLRNIKTNL